MSRVKTLVYKEGNSIQNSLGTMCIQQGSSPMVYNTNINPEGPSHLSAYTGKNNRQEEGVNYFKSQDILVNYRPIILGPLLALSVGREIGATCGLCDQLFFIPVRVQ